MLLLALAGQPVPHSFTVGRPGYQTSATHLAAPYYGGNADGKRAGFDPEFMKRMRRCEFPQFSWDILPIGCASESVLRIDHIQPISTHYKSFITTKYCLSEDALDFMDEWLMWHITALPPAEDSLLGFLRRELVRL